MRRPGAMQEEEEEEEEEEETMQQVMTLSNNGVESFEGVLPEAMRTFLQHATRIPDRRRESRLLLSPFTLYRK